MKKLALPDVLADGLDLLICGSAASRRSAETGNYYAGPGNKFWSTLHEVELTPTLLEPKDFKMLPQFGIGLTDLAKFHSGSDAGLRAGDDDAASLLAKVAKACPGVLAFNGKRAAKSFRKSDNVAYGIQEHAIGGAIVFVLPSTSGKASRYWDIRYWHELAEFVRQFRHEWTGSASLKTSCRTNKN